MTSFARNGNHARSHTRAVTDGLIVAGLIFNATFLLFWTHRFDFFVDAHSWANIDLSHLYDAAAPSLAVVGAFRYAPVVAWLMLPLAALPWPLLVTVYVALSLLALVALAGRRSVLLLIAFPPVLLELLNGNVHLFLALAIWAGFRWPASWAFVLLTKVTPGVGLLWFLFRREWRSLGIALGVTATIVAISWVIAPALWGEWFTLLGSWSGMTVPSPVPTLVVRLPIAIALVWWAAKTDQRWLVPVACLVAMPTIWLQSTAILTACFPLWWERSRARREPEAAVRVHLAEGAA